MTHGKQPVPPTENQAVLSTPADLTNALAAFEAAVARKVRRVKARRFAVGFIITLGKILLILLLVFLVI